ncbi:MAG TPA: VOC family protein [Thermomicrobiales bacterium]|nr:VOC family protein [Thermomicrobiales bacterium]
MAYRFLLEVPEALAAEATVAVESAGDAQVLVVRNSHGLGFDDPYMDLTVASHTLRVIGALYGWFDELGASRPDIRIVLHDGDRLSLEQHDRGAMIAAIRRDQPWVERSLPKIGEHERDTFVTANARPHDAEAAPNGEEIPIATGQYNYPGAGGVLDPFTAEPAPAHETATLAATRRVQLRALNHVAIRVSDLAKAERFYNEFFGMDILGRARRTSRGGYEPLTGDYDAIEAVRTGTEADMTFLRGGEVTLALQRAGRGIPIARNSLLDHISVSVDAMTFANLRGEVLLRGLDPLTVTETATTFRDPFGVVWEIAMLGTPGVG